MRNNLRSLKLFIFFLSFVSVYPAERTQHIRYGNTFASFRNENGKSLKAVHFSYSKDIRPKEDTGFWGYELNFSKENIAIENITWPTNMYPPYEGVTQGGFKISISYIEFLFKIGKSLQLAQKSRFKIYLGSTVSIPVSKKINQASRSSRDLRPNEHFDFDYVRYDADPGYSPIPFMQRGMNVKFCAAAGTSFYWRFIHFDICYWRALNESGDLLGLTLFDKIDRFIFRAGINISSSK